MNGYAKIELSLKSRKNTMTVVAAQYCGDCILMTTDSKGTHVDQGEAILTTIDPKLNKLSNIPIAWASSCAVDVEEDFDRWLKNYTWNHETSWENFRQDALATLNKLNSLKRKSMRDSGVEPKQEDVDDVLIAGYIGGIPEILELTGNGESLFHKAHKFVAIGSGKIHVKIARITLESFLKNYSKEPMPDDLFWFTVAVGIQMVPDCGFPLQRVKITSEKVEDITLPI